MSSASFEQLLKLAQQRAIDGKGGLAASIAKMCLDARADLSPEELGLTFDILRQLIDKVEIQIRRYIADYLAERTDVPADLVDFLANDVINVAYPVLRYSEQISDEQLVEVINSKGHGHHMAISKRNQVSSRVSDALIAVGDTRVLLELLANSSSELSSKGFASAVFQSMRDTDVQRPLLARREVSPAIAKRMYAWVGDAMRTLILANFKIDDVLLDDAITEAFDQLREAEETRIAWRDESGRGHAQRLIGAAETGGQAELNDVIARLTGATSKAVREAMDKDGIASIALICRAFELSTDQFTGLLRIIQSDHKIDKMTKTGELKKTTDFFDRLSLSDARATLSVWLFGAETTTH